MSGLKRVKMRGACLAFLAGLLALMLVPVQAQGADDFAWARKVSDTGTGSEVVHGIAVDGNGDIIIAGTYSGTTSFGAAGNLTATGANDVFVAKMDRLGNFLWVKKIGGAGTDLNYGPNCVCIGPGNNIYVTGRFDSADLSVAGSATIAATGTVDIFVAMLDPAGTTQWVNHPTSAGGVTARGKGIVADSSGNCYVVGHLNGSVTFNTTVPTTLVPANQDVFVCKIDISGVCQWAVSCGGTGTDDGFGIALAAGGGTDPYICGLVAGNTNTFAPLVPTPNTAGGNDAFVAKLDGTNGNFLYAKLAGGVGADQANGICVDATGKAAITGSFTGSATFAPLAAVVATGTGLDCFVAGIDATGANFGFVIKAGANNADDIGNGILLDGAGNLNITGSCNNNAAFGALPAVTTGAADAFVAKLDPSGPTWLVAKGGGSTAADVGECIAQTGTSVIVAGEYGNTATFGTNPTLAFSNGTDVFITKFGPVVAGVSIVQTGPNTAVTEGGATDTYWVALNSQPTATVTITASPDAATTVSAALSFTTANWSVPQAITVTAFNDSIAQGTHSSTITNAASSTDLGYNGIGVAGITATVTDNDVAGVTISKASVNVTEGGATDTYTIVLTSQPTAGTVTVTPSSNTVTGVTTSAAVTFTTGNWNVAQTITVTAVNDLISEGPGTDTITHAVSAT
ncbi:MAG TPA: hypothetical protein VL860_01420, partial [Planctomycetota bacterium]|nr:hypothetical protein [Planctomycetota bacterium]